MSPGILGKKIGMSQVFRPDGQAVPVTLLKAGPCMVVQRKTPTTDGYDAVQLGLVGFVLSLLSESTPLERVAPPVLGLAILVGLADRTAALADRAGAARAMEVDVEIGPATA